MDKKLKNKTITRLIEESLQDSDDLKTTVIFSPSGDSRFKIQFSFKQQVVDLIKSFEGRIYEAETHTWTLPNQYYEEFTKKLKSKIPELTIMPLKNTKKLKPEIQTATISKNEEEDILTISMNYNNSVIKEFKVMKEKFYNPKSLEWSFPLSDLNQIEDILRNNNLVIKYK